MKKLLPALFLLCAATLSAQPIFTDEDVYDVGDVYQSVSVTNYGLINTTSTGANTVWDFSDLQSGEVTSGTNLSPAGQPGSANFPQADICQAVTSLAGNQGNSYMRKTVSSLSLDGIFVVTQAGATVIKYSPDLDIYRFPVSFNASFTTPILGTTTVGDYVIFRIGEETVTCDGYGTLTTPLGTYQNVLRQKTVQTFIDSFYVDGFGPSVTNYESVVYNWFSVQSKGVSLLSHSTLVTNGTPVSYASMSSEPTLSVSNSPSPLTFTVFPNPVDGELTIRIPVMGTELTADICNVTGQIVQKVIVPGNHSGAVTAPLYGLAPGTYFLRLHDGHSSGVQRFVVI